MTAGSYEEPSDPGRAFVAPGPMDADDPVTLQRTGDQWIVGRLEELEYNLRHPDVRQLADKLEQLGVGTLVKLNQKQTLLKECRRLTVGPLPPLPPSWMHESNRIIVETVRRSIPKFITENVCKWDPKKSALNTYFVNYCLLTFKSVYLQFYREETCGGAEDSADNVVALSDAHAWQTSGENDAIDRDTIQEMVRFLDDAEFAKYIQLKLTEPELTLAQIAERLSISDSTLHRRLKKWRKKLEAGGWASGTTGREGAGP